MAVSNFASSISTLEGKFEYRIIPAANYPETSDSVTFEDRQNVVSFLADVVHQVSQFRIHPNAEPSGQGDN